MLESAFEKNRVGAELRRLREQQTWNDTCCPGFHRCRRHHAWSLAPTADDHRAPLQQWIARALDGDQKTVEIEMRDLPGGHNWLWALGFGLWA